ncbi:MAG: tRNA (adenosine(37)-N6)-threonylcarbamoyltransferase complex dimerization subunit type 1 TsaB [Acidimicrobiales bacterium]
MIVLGIETATSYVSVALGNHEGTLASTNLAARRRHAELVAPAIEWVCDRAGVSLGEVRVVAVDVGPGLFTGLRVGVATAKACAQALRVPMIGLSSLDLCAFGVRYSERLVAAVIDARKGEVYWAFYRQVPGGLQRLGAYRISPPSELAAELAARSEPCLAVGDGALRYAEMFGAERGVEIASAGAAHPSAAALVELARPKVLREEFVQVSDIEVLYLRKADAEVNFERRAGHGPPGGC